MCGKAAPPGTVPLGAMGRGCSALSVSVWKLRETSVDLGLWVSKLLDLSKGEKKKITARKTGAKKEGNSVHLHLAQFRGLRA